MNREWECGAINGKSSIFGGYQQPQPINLRVKNMFEKKWFVGTFILKAPSVFILGVDDKLQIFLEERNLLPSQNVRQRNLKEILKKCKKCP